MMSNPYLKTAIISIVFRKAERRKETEGGGPGKEKRRSTGTNISHKKEEANFGEVITETK